MKFYKLNTFELQQELATDLKSGLSQSQAEERLKKDGPNFRMSNSVCHTKFRLLRSLLFILLAAAVYFLTAIFKRDINYVFYGITAAVFPIVCSCALHFLFKWIKHKNSHVSPLDYGKLTVLREGREAELEYRNITYGDVVLLKKGDYIPFDARIIESDGLVADESDIIHENAVLKHAGVINEENADVSRQYNMLFCSSYIVKGSAKAVVTDISYRVYVQRRADGADRRFRPAVRVCDFSKILSLLLLAVSLVFGLISALIASDYLAFFSSAFLLAAVFTADFVSVFAEAAFNICVRKLYKKGVFLKSHAVIDSLNSADIFLIKHSAFYDKGSEISGFILENGEYRELSEVNKSNFSIFLYCSFCNENAQKQSPYYSLKKLTAKVLKGVGIDYKDVSSMCPVISHYSDADSDYAVCGIVYDGSSVLIARGNYTSVLKLCADGELERYHKALDRLRGTSTEIIAVAVKQTDIINADLSYEKSGFKLIGFIGLRRDISADRLSMLRGIKSCGVRSVIICPDNEVFANAFAKQIYKNDSEIKCVSYNSLTDSSEISDCDIIYDFDGKGEKLADICVNNKHTPVYIGGKSADSLKSVAFNTCSCPMYDSKSNDVISNNGIASVYSAVTGAKNVFASICDLLVNEILFAMVFVVCGILFSLMNKSLLFSPQILGLVIFGSVPLSAVLSVFCVRRRGLERTAAFAVEPLQKQNLIFSAVCTVMFVLLTVILKFTALPQTAGGFAAVAFMSAVPPTFLDLDFKNLRNSALVALSFVPALITAVLFMTPASTMFFVSGFSAVHALAAIAVGILIKYISCLISRSAKL
ncbi:MAG: cation-transporting P-type ATPase [Clostridia bacterium]|nr:cation-transporting P-type ATPase [Clostridia bacterium]